MAPRHFTLKTSANLKVESTSKHTLHFSCNGTVARNGVANALLPPEPVRGAATTFYIDLRRLNATRTVSFHVFKDVTLHWTDHGEVKVAMWTTLIGGEQIELGPSQILPGRGKHIITYTRNAKAFTLFEDGKLVAIMRKRRSRIFPTFGVTALEIGSKIDLWLTDIKIHSGLRDETIWAT